MLRIDDAGPVIRMAGEGFFTEAVLRRHFHAVDLIVAQRRRLGRPIIALVDLRRAATQSIAVGNIVTEECDRIYSDPADRVALIVATMLLKLQCERIHHHAGFRTFLAAEEAERFLNEAVALSR